MGKQGMGKEGRGKEGGGKEEKTGKGKSGWHQIRSTPASAATSVKVPLPLFRIVRGCCSMSKCRVRCRRTQSRHAHGNLRLPTVLE